MKSSPSVVEATQLGVRVRQRRKELALTQAELALASGTGVRFISDLENGKSSCQLGRSLQVLAALGLQIRIEPVGGR